MKLNMNRINRLYEGVILSLKISVTYFSLTFISGIIGFLFGIDKSSARGELTILGLFSAFFSYILYSITISVLLLFLIQKVFGKTQVRAKRIWFIVFNSIWNILLIVSFANDNTLEFHDYKGHSNYNTFLLIMMPIIIISNVFWTIKSEFFTSWATENNHNASKYAKNILILLLLYYVSTILSGIFYFISFHRFRFDGFIFDDMIMSINGLIAVILVTSGLFLFLIKRFKFKYFFIIAIPIIYVSYNYYFTRPGFYNSCNTEFHKFREIVIHYNPIWVREDNRGHDPNPPSRHKRPIVPEI